MELLNLTSSSSFYSMLLHFILLYSMSFSLFTNITINVNALGNEADRFSLLKFKESISNDPHGILSSWNDSLHFCDWDGVECDTQRQRLTSLNLEGYNLRGTISPHIGNITFLRFLTLRNNSFFGEIPPQVGRLLRLRHLNLSHNMLEGKIPINLSHCFELRILNFQTNRLTGTIPFELGALAKLEVLRLYMNNLTGGIPASLGNLSFLTTLSVAYNNLNGTLPNELGKLKSLSFFSVGPSDIYGVIPQSIYNLSSISTLSIAGNKFTGTLPPNIGLLLPNLQTCALGGNEFSGTIPESFSNASQLQVLDFGENKCVGRVPTSLGNLPHLRWLSLAHNNFGSHLANSLDFITALTNCTKLEMLFLTNNNFSGALPESVGNLSTRITKLDFSQNSISGKIPPTLENLVNLIYLGLMSNLFTGVIPVSLGRLQNLQLLDLGSNSISGKIPLSISNLTSMFALDVSSNMLEGTIPSNIANCQNLEHLIISNNFLSGEITKEIFGISTFRAISLSGNSLSGSLPVEVGKLKNMILLDLASNNLTNEIPESIGDCESLEVIDLHGNFFQGGVPSTLASLRGLQYLDLSRNNLTGQIPKDLQKLPFLMYLNLSFNDLEGEVPWEGVFQNLSAISVDGNTNLCGGVRKLQLSSCSTKSSKHRKTMSLKLIAVILVCFAVIFILFSCFIVLHRMRKSTRKSFSSLSTINFLSKVSYKKLYQATNGFSSSMLAGAGSFGSVYKGILDQEGQLVAIKVLNLQREGASKSFIAECNALRNIRHRNLVKILTCCSSMDYNGNDFKALVFAYMSNGSLEKWLHLVINNGNQPTGLNMIQRLNIAIDVASAICYLHDDCDPPIIHCDLKPSNVLLDDEMVAHVSDFGLARLISNSTDLTKSKTSTLGIAGTVGYAPPEYAMGGEPSRHGDVYSYGILVLELFTGKRPTDEMLKDDFNLHNFVKTALPERLEQIIDSTLLPNEAEETSRRQGEINYSNNQGINFKYLNQMSSSLHKCLVSVLEIGLACSENSPNGRMNMGDVSRELQHIRNAYMSAVINGERQRIS